MNIITHYRLFRLRVHRHCVRAERRRMRKLLAIRIDAPQSFWPKMRDDRDSIGRSRGENGTPN